MSTSTYKKVEAQKNDSKDEKTLVEMNEQSSI